MKKEDLPDDIRDWMYTEINYIDVRIRKVEEIKGKSIVTGISNNKMDSEVKDFLSEKSTEDSLIVHEYEEDEWGCMSVRFDDRKTAKEFRNLVEEKRRFITSF